MKMPVPKKRSIAASREPVSLHRLHRSLSEGTPSLMRFHAKYVSASEAGDYYQVSFDTEDPGKDTTDPRGPNGPYLIANSRRWMTGNATSRHMTTVVSVTSTSDLRILPA